MAEAPYVTIRSRGMVEGYSQTTLPEQSKPRSATHDTSRVSYHVKELRDFAQTLEESATRAFPNRGLPNQRYKKVQALLLHWLSDDLFVLPELEDLGRCLQQDYAYDTAIFPIPSENSHLELMMRVGQLIKEHESQDTLFIVYYGGHARIDESRQSRWCATRNADSPWLQWSAIQTLLERSISDVLILLDCCAGAASATFPSGSSITETISASSWDAIAPDPGRYSFTNALIEVLQEWRSRTFSAAMLHAEVLARLKHPRPIMINGKYFEARSTPVHFMMTSNHKAPSIEVARTLRPEEQQPISQSQSQPVSRSVSPGRIVDTSSDEAIPTPETGSPDAASIASEPNENVPHVMISLALEDDQRLDLNAWEHWLSSFPALAKYVKVQGVFKSHSTLLLLSMPVMIWDLLPEDQATSFVAFIRSNNLAMEKPQPEPPSTDTEVPIRQRQNQPAYPRPESEFFDDNSTITPSVGTSVLQPYRTSTNYEAGQGQGHAASLRDMRSTSLVSSRSQGAAIASPTSGADLSRAVIYNKHRSARRTTFGDNVPEPPHFASHIENRLEFYYGRDAYPSDADREFIASNLGIDTLHVEAWYYHRREREIVRQKLEGLKVHDKLPEPLLGPRMILPGHLNELLNLSLPGHVLAVDLRSQSEFEKSHIHGAINLRAPADFLRQASPNMLARAFADDQSRRNFGKWQTARCIVFYFKGLELPWECPAAEILYDKFRMWGWSGECFVLKGHYREFSASFSKHIDGIKITKEAKDHADSLRGRTITNEDRMEADGLYGAWLAEREAEERSRGSIATPDEMRQKTEAMEHHEQHVRAEFQAKFSDLYRKAQDHPDGEWSGGGSGVGGSQSKGKGKGKDNFNETSAQMVELLDRGLSKMREGGGGKMMSPVASSPTTPGKGTRVADGYFDGVYAERRPASLPDEYVDVGKMHEFGDVGGLQKAGGHRGEEDEPPKKGRGGGGLLSRVLKRA